MAQAEVNNKTPWEYETLYASDENLRPILTPIVKATFDILSDGKMAIAEEQVPLNLGGEHTDDPETSSYRYEPECAFIKPATDIVVLGDAISPQGPVQRLLVEIYVGSLYKRIGVLGDRQWLKQAAGYRMSEVEPFERIPLIYENAFGGWDRRPEDPSQHIFEARNTVGKGLYLSEIEPTEPLMLPNIENPDQLITSISDRPAPVGCCFTLPHWQPRAALAGTYDEAWMKDNGGRLPPDFDRRFFNGASEGLIADGFLQGNEPVKVTNMTENGPLIFYLPSVRAPVCSISTLHGPQSMPLNFDTLIVDTQKRQIQMIWRNMYTLARGPHEVRGIEIR